jgi:hypothetical protein
VKPTVTFDNAAYLAKQLLSSALAARSEAYARDVELSLHRPAQLTHPVVQLAVDSDDVRYPIASWVQVRVSSWAQREDTAYKLAQLCQGLLLSHHDGSFVGASSSAGPVAGLDSTTGDAVATFTVTARIRGKEVSA